MFNGYFFKVPLVSFKKGTEVSISPMSSTKKTIMFGGVLFVLEVHEITKNNVSSVKTKNVISDLTLYLMQYLNLIHWEIKNFI